MEKQFNEDLTTHDFYYWKREDVIHERYTNGLYLEDNRLKKVTGTHNAKIPLNYEIIKYITEDCIGEYYVILVKGVDAHFYYNPEREVVYFDQGLITGDDWYDKSGLDDDLLFDLTVFLDWNNYKVDFDYIYYDEAHLCIKKRRD